MKKTFFPKKAETAMDKANCFVALDFETADNGRDSACALGLVKVVNNEVKETAGFFIRPPRERFQFTWLHGISWKDVRNHPTFAGRWPEIAEFIDGAAFLTAHNASFDRGVMETCCLLANIQMPPFPFFCTVQLARKTWNLPSAGLAHVCQHLKLDLKHHNAESDALACAKIVIAARNERSPLDLPWKPLGRTRRR